MRNRRLLDHLPCQELVEWGQLHGAVRIQLDCISTRAKGNDRAKWFVGNHADIQFASARLAGHALHRNAVDACARYFARDVFHHALKNIANAYTIHDVERYAINIGFVRDVGRIDLERHRVSQLAC